MSCIRIQVTGFFAFVRMSVLLGRYSDLICLLAGGVCGEQERRVMET